MTNFDRTFCASPDCKGACGRQWTPGLKAEADRRRMNYISFAYFCGEPDLEHKSVSKELQK